MRDIIPELCYPFILGHTGKVGPVTRDSGPGLIHGTKEPGPSTWDSTPETWDPKAAPETRVLYMGPGGT